MNCVLRAFTLMKSFSRTDFWENLFKLLVWKFNCQRFHLWIDERGASLLFRNMLSGCRFHVDNSESFLAYFKFLVSLARFQPQGEMIFTQVWSWTGGARSRHLPSNVLTGTLQFCIWCSRTRTTANSPPLSMYLICSSKLSQKCFCSLIFYYL